MERILKSNNKVILNYLDLKKNFSPIELLDNLERFLAFADVHCMLFKHRIIVDGEITTPQFFDKENWFEIVTSINKSEKQIKDDPYEYLCKYQCDEYLKTAKAVDDKLKQETVELVKKEADKMQLSQKLKHISNSSYIKEHEDKAKASLILLAICELCEEDPLNYRFDIIRKSVLKPATETPKNVTISPLKYEKNKGYNTSSVTLTASIDTYHIKKHIGNTLADGAIIDVVKVTATQGTNKFDNVVIELCDEKTKKVTETVVIKPGEYRICTAVNGAVIQFLPDISVGEKLCLYRHNLSKGDISVYSGNGCKTEIVDNAIDVTSFAAAETLQKTGLFVKDCKLDPGLLLGVDIVTRTKLTVHMSSWIIADIGCIEGKVKILTTDGRVISIMNLNNGQYIWNNPITEKTKVASLSLTRDAFKHTGSDGTTYKATKGESGEFIFNF